MSEGTFDDQRAAPSCHAGRCGGHGSMRTPTTSSGRVHHTCSRIASISEQERERQAPEHRHASRGHPLKSNARCCAELSWCASLAYVNDLSYRDVPNRVLQSVYTALLPPRSLLNDQRVPYPPHRLQGDVVVVLALPNSRPLQVSCFVLGPVSTSAVGAQSSGPKTKR
jgi:hypothetical protein